MKALGASWENRAAARDLIGQALSLYEHSLPCLADSRDLEAILLIVRRLVLRWLCELGDVADLAIQVGRPVLADRERILGKTHPDTFMSRNNPADAYQAAGRLDEAIPLFEATLVGLSRALGEAHPRTLVSRSNGC